MAQGTTKGVPIDTDPTLAANSDLLVPSQKAIKTYIGSKITGSGTTNYLSKWSSTGNLTISSVIDDGANVYFNISAVTTFSINFNEVNVHKGFKGKITAATGTGVGTPYLVQATDFIIRTAGTNYVQLPAISSVGFGKIYIVGDTGTINPPAITITTNGVDIFADNRTTTRTITTRGQSLMFISVNDGGATNTWMLL
jgi:hypothetical protein